MSMSVNPCVVVYGTVLKCYGCIHHFLKESEVDTEIKYMVNLSRKVKIVLPVQKRDTVLVNYCPASPHCYRKNTGSVSCTITFKIILLYLISSVAFNLLSKWAPQQ